MHVILISVVGKEDSLILVRADFKRIFSTIFENKRTSPDKRKFLKIKNKHSNSAKKGNCFGKLRASRFYLIYVIRNYMESRGGDPGPLEREKNKMKPSRISWFVCLVDPKSRKSHLTIEISSFISDPV